MLYSEERTIKVFATPFTLNVGVVGALCKLIEHYEQHKRPFKTGELGLSKGQYTNFAPMKFYGLIDCKDKGSGWWPTQKGFDFYHGLVAVTMPVFHMDNELLPETHPAYRPPYCEKRTTKFIHEIDETRYKQVEEWQEMMRGNPTLNI